MRRLPALLVAVALLGACGSQQTAKPASGYQVYATDGRSILAFDAASGSQLRAMPVGSPAPDWSALFVAQAASGKTNLQALDPRTGSMLRSITLEGQYHLPQPDLSGLPAALSPDGRWLVLEDRALPKSWFVVLDTSFRAKPRMVELEGDFAFDALSNDGSRLYLLQYSTPTPTYSVRLYDLRLGRLRPDALVDKREPDEAMQGSRVTSVNSPTGDYHYGLYARENNAPFIHALPLDDEPFAWCVDLPVGADTGAAWSLARTPDGRVYAVNTAGLVAEVRPGEPPAVARTLKLQSPQSWIWKDAEAKEIPGTSAAVVPGDGRTLYAAGPEGIYAVDLQRFAVIRSWPLSLPVVSLVAAPDGTRIFALTESLKMYEIDLASGQVGAGVYLHPLSPAASLALLR